MDLDSQLKQEEERHREAFNLAFGQRVRDARRARGFKAEMTAEMAGITAQFLSDVERGKKGLSSYNLAPLARALGVSSDYLLYGRRDADERITLVSEYLISLPPAQRDMAIELLEQALNIIKSGIPK